ncbi:MAG TPA: DUF5916 domain-containing protein [Steroidobacteraceae bacterium]|nr:DUF5916 domain-containing protein [Steroidobacteraceae bacterium]
MRVAGLVSLSLFAGSAFAVQIDGRVDAGEWQEARHVTDFRKVQPLNGEPATLATEAWVLATPEGLAVAFHNTHPASVPRTRERVQRDFSEQVDRVNLVVDFDGDHRTGYNFRVSSTDGIADAIVTNENSFNTDWDGNWRHAVSEDAESWSVEMLIPWHIAPMRNATDKRTINLYLDRITGSTGERVAWPLASLDRSRYLSDFAPVEVPAYSQALLAMTPYVSGLYDNTRSDGEPDAGVDVFWKPNGQLQLTATVNPDFGQVESDDLVVNFDAEETFFSDKRPFFTENQGLFEFTTPSDFSQLLYTRRVGGPADDGRGLGDIIAALKLNGSMGSTKYGLFAAEEDEDVGRSFQAVRLVRDFSEQNLGLMATRTERPFLDRVATVAGVDHDWRPTPRWNIRSRVFGSDIKHDADGNTRDVGATVWADYEMDRGWRQQWIAMYFGDELEINDAGYLSRNNTEYLHWQVNRRFTDLPADSRYSSKDWRWRVSSNYSATGQQLNHQFRMSRESRLRNGSYEYGQINVNSAGVDDLILRGNGFVKRPPNFNSFFELDRPRKGNWGFHGELEISSGGLEGNRNLGYFAELTPKYFISDAFNIYVGLTSSRNPDWLVWQRENLLGSFGRRNAEISAGFNWTMTNRQELRLKLQAIGLDARLRQGYRIDAAGNALETAEAIDDFTVRNLGVQLRYRFEIAPLSYLYVVYGRGGFRNEPRTEDSVGLLGDSFSLRDDEQLLVKFSYRFET